MTSIVQTKDVVETNRAPQAVGPYSQAVKVGNTVYISGQIPLNPKTGTLISDQFEDQTHQVLKNLSAVATAAGGHLGHVVQLTVYLTDMAQFSLVNEIMSEYFEPPYPSRAAVGVQALPKGSQIEMTAIMAL